MTVVIPLWLVPVGVFVLGFGLIVSDRPRGDYDFLPGCRGMLGLLLMLATIFAVFGYCSRALFQ